NLKNVIGILKCTEIFIQKPSYMLTRSQTYSGYKHHNTVKVIITVSSSGAITILLFQGHGGRVSSKELTLKSGLLNIVREGDIYLVDRGFRGQKMFAAKGANLLIPAFTKGKKHLGAEVTLSRKLSQARSHVERAMKRLKVFRIFQTVLPTSFVKKSGDIVMCTIDKALIVSAAVICSCPCSRSRSLLKLQDY
ncbi:hypothetical protein IscW_ISCW024251, partial [Ixodes scapularis]